LLIAIFGGLTMGAGVGLILRCGGVIDGAEVIAVFTKRKTGFSSNEQVSPVMKLFCFSTPLFLPLQPHNLD